MAKKEKNEIKSKKTKLPELTFDLTGCGSVVIVCESFNKTANRVINLVTSEKVKFSLFLMEKIDGEKAKNWPNEYDTLIYISGSKVSFEKL
ncbi:hypothetical protein KAR28_02900 [Candidatus Parcubacteria bacterium]|nr:hypothetical protein [Candidatus Parcubacteria bacterium]